MPLIFLLLFKHVFGNTLGAGIGGSRLGDDVGGHGHGPVRQGPGRREQPARRRHTWSGRGERVGRLVFGLSREGWRGPLPSGR